MVYWSSVPGAAWCSMDLGSAYRESDGGGGKLHLNEKITMVMSTMYVYASLYTYTCIQINYWVTSNQFESTAGANALVES